MRLMQRFVILSPYDNGVSMRQKNSKCRWSRKYEAFRRKIFERDEFKCKYCECTDAKKLHLHHIIPWEKDENLRYEELNNITLCKSCHGKVDGFQKGHRNSSEVKEQIRLKKIGKMFFNKGKKLSAAHKSKLKGRTPWNKGKKTPSDVIEKLRASHLGLPSGNKGKKGQIAWNKGISPSLETRKKMSLAKTKLKEL